MSLITPDFGLLVWMTLIFGIVFFILAKFGFPVITSMVDKRAEHIEQALKDAEKAHAELEGMQSTCQKMLEETRVRQAEMLDTASKTSRQMIEDAKAQASKEAALLISNARAAIEVEKQEAINDVRNAVVELSVAMSEKILRSELSNESTQKVFLDKLMDEVRNAPRDKK